MSSSAKARWTSSSRGEVLPRPSLFFKAEVSIPEFFEPQLNCALIIAALAPDLIDISGRLGLVSAEIKL